MNTKQNKNKEYYQNNKELLKKKRKEYYEKNKNKEINRQKKYNKDNKNKIKDYSNNNKEHLKEYQKEYREKNIEKRKEYLEKNKESIRDKNNKYLYEKRKQNPLYKLSVNIKNSIRKSINGKKYTKKSRSFEILGCSFEELKQYLENKFESWMNWENHGNPKDGIFEPNKTWDIDHIIPLISANNEEELLVLNHYTNLQPLCSCVNRWIKKDYITL